MLRIGHRGACGYMPENTLISFAKALELNVDMIELDVYACKSGEIVVFHDSGLKRVTGKYGNIEKLSLTQLKSYNIGIDQKIPTLIEVLDLINAQTAVNVELKGKGIGATVNSIIMDYCNKGWKMEQFLVSSFDVDQLVAFRSINSTLSIGLVFEKVPENIDVLIEEIKPYSVHLNYKKLKEDDVRRLQKMNIKVFAYTVNDKPAIGKMKQMGVDGVFLDYPDRV